MSSNRANKNRLRTGIVWSILIAAYCSIACSIPNLEEPQCDQARDVVREFYSLHFGNDMTPSPENLEKRKEYLTPEFYEALKTKSGAGDPFTQTTDLPKAFRVGECKIIEPGTRTSFDVLLFWKDDVRTEQRSIRVETESRSDKWLIGSVTGEGQNPERY